MPAASLRSIFCLLVISLGWPGCSTHRSRPDPAGSPEDDRCKVPRRPTPPELNLPQRQFLHLLALLRQKIREYLLRLRRLTGECPGIQFHSNPPPFHFRLLILDLISSFF